METTIIKAYDCEDKGKPQSVFLFSVRHKPGTDVEKAIKDAFKEYAATPEGKEFIDDEGSNWGDSLNIPQDVLERHGIFEYDVIGYDGELVVDHNESLLD